MNITQSIKDGFGSGVLLAQKHSPVLLTAAGVVGVVAAGVLASRATLKLEATVEKAEQRLATVAEHDGKKVTAVALNFLDIIKLYGPSVTLGAASLVCIVSAQGILHKRNAALVVAYKGLEQAYTNYRERVVESYGEDVDRDFYYGVQRETVTGEDGKKKEITTLKDPNANYGGTTFIFGPSNPNWSGNHEQNEFYLNMQQNYLNDLLQVRGHVFLNEVLDRVGLERTPDGAIKGWKKDGDKVYIDFQQYRLDSEQAKDYGISEPGHILLNFNITGLIWDQI